MDIDWMALVEVAAVAFAFGVGIVTVFSLGIVGAAAASPEGSGDAGAASTATAHRTGGRVVSVVCFAACAAAVLYGLWLIIPQFH